LIKVPFLSFAHNSTPNFLWQPERLCSIKGSKSKKAEQKERKGARKWVIAKKQNKTKQNRTKKVNKSNFWL